MTAPRDPHTTATDARSPATLTPLALLAAAMGAFAFAHDFVGVGIALPEIQDHFSVSLGTLQWTLTGFSIAVAMAVVPGGRLADAYGAGRMFVVGAFGFAAASMLIVVAPTMWVLLLGRVFEGLAAGLLWTATIALVFGHFGPRRAGLAGAFAVGIGGLGQALGPIDTGLLVEWLGWRAAFALNVPLCLFAGLVILRSRPTPVAGIDRAIDWTGIAILATSLVILLVTLRYASDWGWGSAQTIVGFLATLATLALFALQQRAWGPRALVPPDVAANRIFVTTLAAEALLGGSFFLVLAFGPQIFTHVLDAGAIEAGLMQVPTMLAFAVAAALAGLVGFKIRPAVKVPAAGAVAAGGGLVLALMPDDPSYLALLPGFLLVGAGTGAAFSSLVAIGVDALPEDRSGLAGGLLYTAQLAGGAILLAAGTAIATEVASGAEDQRFDGLVQGAQSGFLFGVGIAVVGILGAAIGYRVRTRAPT